MQEPQPPPPQPRPTDEQISAFEQSIKAEEVGKRPLVAREDATVHLKPEYENGARSFLEKLDHLVREKYTRFRRCRGDGNCFYRAFSFAFFQSLLRDDVRLAMARTEADGHKELLLVAGFEEFAFTDFYEVYVDVLNRLHSAAELRRALVAGGGGASSGTAPPTSNNDDSDNDDDGSVEAREEALYVVMQDLMTSNAIVVHLRLLASAYLKTNAESYAPFLDDGMTVELFCNHYVEAMDREADQIQIIALTKAMKQGITVAYLDASGSSKEATLHRFLPTDDPDRGDTLPICLLYRPGHYDILYREEE